MTQRTYPAGVTSWVDLSVDDVEATKEFYAGLFGWTFEQATPPGIPVVYAIARLDGRDVGGLGGPAEPTGTATGTWNTYVAVDDLEATIAAVEAAGGTLVDPVEQAGEGGWNATVADPSGLELRLWKARNRLGSQVTNEPGSWNFSDLSTSDPEGAKAFYGRVFGWEFGELGFATMIRRPGYGDHLAATIDPGIHERQSEVDAPPGFADAIGWLGSATEETPPGWHVTFTVADRDETAARVVELGGQVLREDDTDWTKTAVVVDPQGARFTTSQFTPPSG